MSKEDGTVLEEFPELLDRKFRHRKVSGESRPRPGRLRLTGDTDSRAYEGVRAFCEATADIALSDNMEIEAGGGIWLPVDPLWGLLALRRFELEQAGQAGD